MVWTILEEWLMVWNGSDRGHPFILSVYHQSNFDWGGPLSSRGATPPCVATVCTGGWSRHLFSKNRAGASFLFLNLGKQRCNRERWSVSPIWDFGPHDWLLRAPNNINNNINSSTIPTVLNATVIFFGFNIQGYVTYQLLVQCTRVHLQETKV